MAQVFDTVWHEGLVNKLNKLLPKQYVDILTSYITDRTFRIKQESEYSDLMDIKAGVPQGSVLGPVLYLLYTCDIPVLRDVTLATFADDTALIATEKDPILSTAKVQHATDEFLTWTQKWRIKLNEQKSVHVNFTNQNMINPPSLVINGTLAPHENNAKYLGINSDVKLRWKHHIKKKREELDLRYKKYYWLLGRKSQLSIHNKILVYKQIFKPVWLYGSQLWGCSKDSNIEIIQKFQNKVLRNIVNAPWYTRNKDIHRDLNIPLVVDEIKKMAAKHEERLHHHPNAEALQLLDNQHPVRRLKRTKPFELV